MWSMRMLEWEKQEPSLWVSWVSCINIEIWIANSVLGQLWFSAEVLEIIIHTEINFHSETEILQKTFFIIFE